MTVMIKNNILAVIPAYNESDRISAVVTSAGRFVPVLVVDDGSTDRTAEVLAQLGTESIRLWPNQGKGAALIAGLRYAVDHGYDAVLTLDADGQHDPQEIPLFIKEFEQGSDLVIGRRTFSKMPFPRNISNAFGTWLFSNALGQSCPDNQSGYRLHSKRMAEAGLQSDESNFEFEVEIIVRCVVNGFRLSWVPIKTIYAGEHSHIKPLRHIRNFFRIVRKTRQMIRESKGPR